MTVPGSFASFDEFYRSQIRRLVYFFSKRVGRDEANDLAQEAFTGMLRCGAFERVENPEAYLFRTAHNLVFSQARRKKRRPSVVVHFDDERDAPTLPEQERLIEASELRRIFRRTLRAMPRRTRRIFLMHRLRGMSYRAIAERLSIGEKSVEYHMMCALARCRRAISTRI